MESLSVREILKNRNPQLAKQRMAAENVDKCHAPHFVNHPRLLACMADPHAVPLPPSRGSLDSNRGSEGGPAHPHPASHSTQLDSLPEQDTHEDAGQNGADEMPDNSTGLSGQAAEDEDERIRTLEDELDRTRQDRDAWEQQYQSLLAKLTTMRQTVGDKIKQDAVSLTLSLVSNPERRRLNSRAVIDDCNRMS